MNFLTNNQCRFHGTKAGIFQTLFTAALMLPNSVFAIPPVNLGSTASFAIVAGAAITNTPHSAITGNIGLSPTTGAAITGFGTTEVRGIIYTVDAAYPIANAVMNPVGLSQVKADLTKAYNDAASRTPVPTGRYLNPGAGNLGGLTLGPGLYKFTAAALLSGSNLTLIGSSRDVWIFQVGSALTVVGSTHVNLVGGARAANVFWQIGSSATLGGGSVMQGTIMADQSITLVSGATLYGRALARVAAVTLHANTVTKP